MLNCNNAARNQKYVLPTIASQSGWSFLIRTSSLQKPSNGFALNFFAGSAGGTRVMPKLQSKPTPVSPSRINPDHPCRPRNTSDKTAAPIPPAMMATHAPSSSTPLPQESFRCGRIYATNSYYDG